jgi:hypothetical protein
MRYKIGAEQLEVVPAMVHGAERPRSSGRKLSEVAREMVAGQPLPRGRARPTLTPTGTANGDAGTPQLDA